MSWDNPRNEVQRLQFEAVQSMMQGANTEAEALLLKALPLAREMGGEADTLHLLGDVKVAQEDLEEAEGYYVRAATAFEAEVGPDTPQVAHSLVNLAKLRVKRGRFEEAEPLYLRALDIQEKAFGAGHVGTAGARRALARLYERQGRTEEAEALVRQSQASIGQFMAPVFAAFAEASQELNLESAELTPSESADLEPHLASALALTEQLVGPDHPGVIPCLEQYATLLRKLGRDEEAQRMEDRAARIRDHHPSNP